MGSLPRALSFFTRGRGGTVDATGLGPVGGDPVDVQVLSPAPRALHAGGSRGAKPGFASRLTPLAAGSCALGAAKPFPTRYGAAHSGLPGKLRLRA